jgi:glyoxylase-like metal-dependent hydrolase (beta-lactamase superfamily II)
MAAISPKPVSTMILTHSDMDHVYGLPGWPKNIKIIAQENTKADLQDAMAGKGPPTATPMPVPDGMEAYLPTHLVRHRDTMEIDGVRIILTHLSAGHTNGDLLVGSVANSDTVSKIGLMYCQGQLR